VADFFQFLTSPEIQVFYHKATGYVAITKAAYEKAKAEGYYKEKPVAEVGIQQLSLPGGDWSKGYRLGFYPQIRAVMEREYNRISATSQAKSRRRLLSKLSRRKATTFWPASPRRPADRSLRNR